MCVCVCVCVNSSICVCNVCVHSWVRAGVCLRVACQHQCVGPWRVLWQQCHPQLEYQGQHAELGREPRHLHGVCGWTRRSVRMMRMMMIYIYMCVCVCLCTCIRSGVCVCCAPCTVFKIIKKEKGGYFEYMEMRSRRLGLVQTVVDLKWHPSEYTSPSSMLAVAPLTWMMFE